MIPPIESVNRRTILLREMGLGPLWQLREPESMLGNDIKPAADIPERPSTVPETSLSAISTVALNNAEHAVSTDPAELVQAVMQNPSEISIPTISAATSDVSTSDVADMPEAAMDSMESISAFAPQYSPIATSPEKTPIEKMDWDELQAAVSTCQACNLCHSRKNTVFGVGDRQADWLFVGEGPGYNENIQGMPFVGAAGQLLDNMLRSLRLKRGDRTFIANIVKCRPTDEYGKDRPPTEQEVAACLPYLRRQIELIQPQMIVALGKTAAVSLLGLPQETPVGQLREKTHRYQATPLVVTYHPAYLLRKPADKRKAWADLCMAKAIVPSSES